MKKTKDKLSHELIFFYNNYKEFPKDEQEIEWRMPKDKKL